MGMPVCCTGTAVGRPVWGILMGFMNQKRKNEEEEKNKMKPNNKKFSFRISQ